MCSALLGAAVAAACTGTIEDPPDQKQKSAAFSPGPSSLRVLTPRQYARSVRDLLGADVPVEEIGQWRSSIAAAQGGVAPALVKAYEQQALSVSEYVFGDDARRSKLVGCTPSPVADDDCTRDFLTSFGRKAWRRPLTTAELARYSGVASQIGVELGAWRGLELAVAGLLQSPNFIYRVELGEPVKNQPERLAFSGFELASRLSYFIWGTTPDDALLDAAAAGELERPETLAKHVDRLLADERATEGTVEFYADLLDLDALLHLEKDAQHLTGVTPTLGASMREQLVRTVSGVSDFRELFTTRNTFVNAELAALMDLPGTFGSDFQAVTLAADSPRAGLLTLPGLLAIHSGQADTSPTLRGKFVRTVLLCQTIPPPPPGVVTSLPAQPPDQLVTTRDLLGQHQTDPICAGCHARMDPIGLALESFDAIGRYRTTQNDLPIDTSGEIDGIEFADARGLSNALANHPDLGGCFVRKLYRYATAHIEGEGEEVVIASVQGQVESANDDVKAALRAIALSDGFRYAAREVLP